MKNVKGKILFVCHGNICRSPMAEYILKSLTDEYYVESRATHDDEIGNDMHYKTKKLLDEHNINYNIHSAKKITLEDYNNFDLIVCFDEYNLINLKNMFGNDKIIKLNTKDVDDPWYTGDFEKTYSEIYEGCLNLLKYLEVNYGI